MKTETAYLRYIVRRDGPFGASYLQRVHVPGARKMFGSYSKPNEASKFMFKETAESFVLLLAARHPDLIGQISVREWNGRKRYP